MEIKESAPSSQLLARVADDGTPIYWTSGNCNLTLPDNLSAGTYVQVEWPKEREGGFAYYRVDRVVKPPEGGDAGVYLYAFKTEQEYKEYLRKNPDFPTHKVSLSSLPNKPGQSPPQGR